jgi:hypothetical protein
MMSGRVDVGENASLFRTYQNGPPSALVLTKVPLELGTITHGDNSASLKNAHAEQIVGVVRLGNCSVALAQSERTEVA